MEKFFKILKRSAIFIAMAFVYLLFMTIGFAVLSDGKTSQSTYDDTVAQVASVQNKIKSLDENKISAEYEKIKSLIDSAEYKNYEAEIAEKKRLEEEAAQKKAEEVAKAEAENEKNIENFKKILKKHNTNEIINLYNSVDENTKNSFKELIDTEYTNYVKGRKSDFDSLNISEIHEIYSELQFLNSIPLQGKNIWSIYTNIKTFNDNYNKLEELTIQNPDVENTGLIKDINDVQEISCYVNYRIKNSKEQIGNITIKNESFSDMYFISSYTYYGYLNYTPNNDWQAIIIPRGTTVEEKGAYVFYAIQNGTKTLIDSNGFEKDYPLYYEITEKDIDTYNNNISIIEEKDNLKTAVDKSLSKLNECLK